MEMKDKNLNQNLNFLLKEYEELIRYIFKVECDLFMKMESYRILEQKRNLQSLSQKEQQQFYKDIYSVFVKLTQTIQDACPDLTKEDIVFCCLMRLGLDNTTISCCMGNITLQAFNQRKYRIKKKLKETESNELIDLIFHS